MHVIVPTLDLITMLSKLRPMRSVVTSGFQFAIYTLEAYDQKLKLIVGDRSSITASMEIFADVKQEGKVSINGTDFYETMIKIVPDAKSTVFGSKNITLKSTDTKLNMSTTTYYSTINTKIDQKRSFSRVATDIKVTNSTSASTHEIQTIATHLSDIFKISNRLISSYTSDMAGLSGILLRVKQRRLFTVVSDGMRILEVVYPSEVDSEDFDVILPKMTATLLQALIEDGDEVVIKTDSRRVQFYINSDGLQTYVASNIIRANFPEYEAVFAAQGSQFKVDSQVISDNVSNVRKSLNDETYRVRIIFDGQKSLSLSNCKSSSHLQFSNEGIPVEEPNGSSFDIIANAFLLEGLLVLLKTPQIKIIVPPDNKPMVLSNLDSDLKIRTAIALARE